MVESPGELIAMLLGLTVLWLLRGPRLRIGRLTSGPITHRDARRSSSRVQQDNQGTKGALPVKPRQLMYSAVCAMLALAPVPATGHHVGNSP